jgi:NADH/F420H2 dehydrogenase subunit C
MSKKVIERLKTQFGGKILATSDFRGDDEAVVAPESWLEVARFLREDPELAFDHFIDLTAVDYPMREDLPRFDVLVFVRSMTKNHRVRLKTRVGEGQAVPSLFAVWPGSSWAEREVFDMFGVTFEGHPDLRRILLYPEFQGHPLRKDYPIEKVQPHEELDEDGQLELPASRCGSTWARRIPRCTAPSAWSSTLDGETITDVDIQPGYLHRGFEKMCERGTWNQVYPYVDRLNYVSPMLNNVGFSLAVEKLLGSPVPDRCTWYRMILGELARISDHLTCNGAMRDGARRLHALPLVHQDARDTSGTSSSRRPARASRTASAASAAWPSRRPSTSRRTRSPCLPQVEESIAETRRSSSRTASSSTACRASATSAPSARSPSAWTGPVLRSTGVDYDVRKAQPVHVYDARLRRAGGPRRRQLRPLHVSAEEIRQSHPHHRAVHREDARLGPGQHRRPALRLPPRSRTSTTRSRRRSPTSRS